MREGSDTKLVGAVALVAMAVAMFISSALMVLKGEAGTPYQTMVPLVLDVLSIGLCMMLFMSLVTDKHADRSTFHFIILLLISFIVLVSSAISWYAEGDSDLNMLNEVFSTIEFLGFLLMSFALWWFLNNALDLPNSLSKKTDTVVIVIFVLGALNILANLYFHHLSSVDGEGVYTNSDLIYLGYVPALLIVLMCTLAITYCERDIRRKIALYSFTFVPVVYMVVPSLFGGAEIADFLLFITMLIMYGNFYVKRSEDLMRKENELLRQRAEILVSQIQPHFLYNALTSIMNIKGNSPEVRDAIADFGKYLRGNLDTLKQHAPIPILKEIDHIETFMELEKLNLGRGLELQLDIRDRNFLIPSLSLQKLIEKCIEKDYPAKDPSGVISVTTREAEDSHFITVTDDGMGFNADVVLHEDLADVFGIQTVESRVREQVNGSVYIESSIGAGTTITIEIPKNSESSLRFARHYTRQVTQ